MISGANINLDFLYLVNKKDLKGILETGDLVVISGGHKLINNIKESKIVSGVARV